MIIEHVDSFQQDELSSEKPKKQEEKINIEPGEKKIEQQNEKDIKVKEAYDYLIRRKYPYSNYTEDQDIVLEENKKALLYNGEGPQYNAMKDKHWERAAIETYKKNGDLEGILHLYKKEKIKEFKETNTYKNARTLIEKNYPSKLLKEGIFEYSQMLSDFEKKIEEGSTEEALKMYGEELKKSLNIK